MHWGKISETDSNKMCDLMGESRRVRTGPQLHDAHEVHTLHIPAVIVSISEKDSLQENAAASAALTVFGVRLLLIRLHSRTLRRLRPKIRELPWKYRGGKIHQEQRPTAAERNHPGPQPERGGGARQPIRAEDCLSDSRLDQSEPSKAGTKPFHSPLLHWNANA